MSRKYINTEHDINADDLFILCFPDSQPFQIVHNALMEFHKYSGLQPNRTKSRILIAGVPDSEIPALCDLMGFQLGNVPFRYLGVPLISSQLSVSDCSLIIDKITTKIKHWENKTLSYAGTGRLQIIKSILFSIHVFGSMHFVLPKSVCLRMSNS